MQFELFKQVTEHFYKYYKIRKKIFQLEIKIAHNYVYITNIKKPYLIFFLQVSLKHPYFGHVSFFYKFVIKSAVFFAWMKSHKILYLICSKTSNALNFKLNLPKVRKVWSFKFKLYETKRKYLCLKLNLLR